MRIRGFVVLNVLASLGLAACVAAPEDDGASSSKDAVVAADANAACLDQLEAVQDYWAARGYENGAIPGMYEACIEGHTRVACKTNGRALFGSTRACGSCDQKTATTVACSGAPSDAAKEKAAQRPTCMLEEGGAGRATAGAQSIDENGTYFNEVAFTVPFEGSTAGKTVDIVVDYVFPDGKTIQRQWLTWGTDSVRNDVLTVPFSYSTELAKTYPNEFGPNTGTARFICQNGSVNIPYAFTRTR